MPNRVLEMDMAVASTFGRVEDNLGIASTFLTVFGDSISGNFGYDKEIGLYVGKDSVISARNTGMGLIPESILDAAVSNSQMAYNIERKYGGEPGGFVPVFSSEFVKVLFEFSWYK
jgi:hypothetical protein